MWRVRGGRVKELRERTSGLCFFFLCFFFLCILITAGWRKKSIHRHKGGAGRFKRFKISHTGLHWLECWRGILSFS